MKRNNIRNIIQKSRHELQLSHYDSRDCHKTSDPKGILGLLFKICIKLLKGSDINDFTFVGAGNKLEGDVGDKVSLQAQTSPCFQLRGKFTCIEHIDKSETQLKTSR